MLDFIGVLKSKVSRLDFIGEHRSIVLLLVEFIDEHKSTVSLFVEFIDVLKYMVLLANLILFVVQSLTVAVGLTGTRRAKDLHKMINVIIVIQAWIQNQ